VSVLDPKCTAGNGSNDHGKIEFRHQRNSSSRHSGGQGIPTEMGHGSRTFNAAHRAGDPDVRHRHLRLAFRGPS